MSKQISTNKIYFVKSTQIICYLNTSLEFYKLLTGGPGSLGWYWHCATLASVPLVHPLSLAPLNSFVALSRGRKKVTRMKVQTDIYIKDYFIYCFFFQDEEQAQLFGITHSVESKYMIGVSLESKFCEKKMREDIVILEISFDSIIVAKANNQRATTLLEQIGLIGICIKLI